MGRSGRWSTSAGTGRGGSCRRTKRTDGRSAARKIVIRKIAVRHHASLEDYATEAILAQRVEELRAQALPLARALRGRTVWMVNSTATGGGVAEMLPATISLLRDVGVAAEWLVIEPKEPEFFVLTKRIHNMLHGVGDGALDSASRALFDRVARELAVELREFVRPGDILVIHDPQPLGAGARIRDEVDVVALWRCHIGLEHETDVTREAWDFLEPYATRYDHSLFSAAEYIPPRLREHASVSFPALDPLSEKNRELTVHEIFEVIDAIGIDPHRLLSRPLITQISRWDRLKGFAPLLAGFAALKQSAGTDEFDPVRRVQLVLAGPDPAGVDDDPEALEVLAELHAQYAALPPETRASVLLLELPMVSIEMNALMVNALQRAATFVVQNSLREGFGLTVAEGMWKRVPILGSGVAFGVKQQVRHEIEGLLVPDPSDAQALAGAMRTMLGLSAEQLRALGRNGQARVHGSFLIFRAVADWLDVLHRATQLDFTSGAHLPPDPGI